MEQKNVEQGEADIARFLDEAGRITFFPKKRDKRDAILAYLAKKFEVGRDYKEREVNGIIDAWHTFGDLFILRREMIEAGVLHRTRDGARYWREAAEAEQAPDRPAE